MNSQRSSVPEEDARDLSGSAASLELRNVTKSYGETLAVDNLSLKVEPGEFLVLLGPSGCGKTTTMRSIVGLETPQQGTITIGERVLFDGASGQSVPPDQRGMGMVFQSYAIWPHMTVGDNVAFPLRRAGVGKREAMERVRVVLETVGLGGLNERGASKLSGGQMQRVALARSLVMRPPVLLLDEPLSNLDARLRDQLRLELKLLQAELGVSTIYVTHDQGEALALADRIAVMDKGRIVQLDEPETIYTTPANAFVADFMGVSNLFPCQRVEFNGTDATCWIDGIGSPLHATVVGRPQGAAVLCIRPDAVKLGPGSGDGPAGSDWTILRGRIAVTTYGGSHFRHAVRLSDDVLLEVLEFETRSTYTPGEEVVLWFNRRDANVLEAQQQGGRVDYE